MLVSQIFLLEFFCEKLHEGQGDNQGNHSLTVLIEDLQHFLFFKDGEIVFEITKNMTQYIAVLFDSALFFQAFIKNSSYRLNSSFRGRSLALATSRPISR